LGFRRTCEQCGSRWDATVAFCPRDGQGLGPAKLDRYILVRALAHIGMSDVFEAKHEFTKKRVALKLISSDAAKHDETAERLRREGRAASAMGDPNIVDITDFGVDDDGGVYMVMEWLDGKTLREVLDDGPVPVEQALDLAAQTASGLASAHSIGVVHRDVKPENLMVIESKDGSPLLKILDFGIAKVAGRELEKLTRTGTIVGTPAYMSPEQAQGEPVDARSDVYSLGCVIYELFTGEVPFSSPSVMEVVLMHVDAEPTLPSVFAPRREIPPAIDAVIMRCLAKDPRERYSSMTALRSDLLSLAKDGLALPVRAATSADKLDSARTIQYQSGAVPKLAAPPIAERAMPEAGLVQSRSKRPLMFGLLLIAVAAVAAVALLPNETDKGLAADSNVSDAARNTADEFNTQVAVLSPETRPADDAGGKAAPVEPDAGQPVPAKAEVWTSERSHSKFGIVLSASGMLAPRAPIDLQFKLKNLKDRVSWAVTEGRLQARIEFVHFVRHDMMGRVTAKVDDQGEFRAILSVPQTGKYHLKIRLSDGSKVVGRSQLDICVGALPGSPQAESLCPKLGEFSSHHGAAR
jgi:serine/threonine protein kinase